MNGQSSGSEATESSELDAMGNNVGLLGLTIYSPPRNSLSRTTLIPFNEVGESWTEVDGLLMPGSMANPNALQASVLYQSDDGTLTRREYDFINDLPGVYRAPFPSSILGHSDGSRVSAEAAEAWAAGQARSGRSSSEFSGLISQNSMTFFDNPNCIKKVLRDKEGGEVEAERTHNLRAGPPMTKNEPPYGSNLNANAHDGIHIVASPGAYSVVALGAMAGKVLHYGPQNPPKGYMESVYGPMLSNLDIQLNVKINGDWLVLTLKDMRYESGAYTPGRKINAGTILGTVTTSKDYKNDMSESSGLHVTLMTLSTYNKYIKDKFSSTARASVPYTKLIDAELDPTSPFRCP